MKKYINKCFRYTATIYLLYSMTAWPLQADVRRCIEKNLDYLKNVMQIKICQIPANIMPDKSCRYQWLLDLEKEAVGAISDSLIFGLTEVIGTRFYDFPSNTGARYMNDPFCVAYYVALFCDSTMPISRRSESFKILLKKTSDGVLLPHRKEIITMLHLNWLEFSLRTSMAALLNCTKKELSVFENGKQEFSLHVKARYGDKEAVALLIEKFDSAAGYESKLFAMRDLFFTGKIEVMRHVLEQFDLKIYKSVGGCILQPFQYDILLALAYYHVADPIFNEELSAAIKKSLTTDGENAVAEYYQKVYAWIFEHYKVKPSNPPPFLFFMKRCIQR